MSVKLERVMVIFLVIMPVPLSMSLAKGGHLLKFGPLEGSRQEEKNLTRLLKI